MVGEPAIWVIASKHTTGARIQEMLQEVRLLNPVIVIENSHELKSMPLAPLLIFLDLGWDRELSWEVLRRFCEDGWEGHVIALVDDQSEALLDRAYEAGVKTYLRKEFTFADFLERVRMLEMRFVLEREKN